MFYARESPLFLSRVFSYSPIEKSQQVWHLFSPYHQEAHRTLAHPSAIALIHHKLAPHSK